MSRRISVPEHPQAVALAKEKADMSTQIFGELKQLTESYRNEYEVALARETALRANVAAAKARVPSTTSRRSSCASSTSRRRR